MIPTLGEDQLGEQFACFWLHLDEVLVTQEWPRRARVLVGAVSIRGESEVRRLVSENVESGRWRGGHCSFWRSLKGQGQ